MTRTWSLRSAAMLLGKCVGLILLGAGLAIAPALAQNPQEAMQTAISDFNKITIPTLMKMEPFIEKSGAERLAAYKSMRLDDKTCDSGAVSGHVADQPIAEGAALICKSLAAWLGGNDIFACVYGGWDIVKNASVGAASTNAQMKKSYQEHGVQAIDDRLQVAVGCAHKDKSYWARRTVEAYYAVASGPNMSRAGKVGVTNAIGQMPFRSCYYAGIKAGETYGMESAEEAGASKVAGAAFHACGGIESYLYSISPTIQFLCNEMQGALDLLALNPGTDILESERPKMNASIEAYYAALKCDPIVTASKVAKAAAAEAAAAEAVRRFTAESAEPAPPTPSGPSRIEQANALIGMINGEQQNYSTNVTYAKNWYDRGETVEACRYYQKQLYNVAALKADYAKLGDILGTTEYRDEVAQYEEEQRIIYDNENDDCRDAGVILSY